MTPKQHSPYSRTQADHDRERHARAVAAAAFLGRHGDTELAHLTEGEMVIPPHILTPELHAELAQAFAAAGADMGRYTVGGADDSCPAPLSRTTRL
jgi:hypothetical protein